MKRLSDLALGKYEVLQQVATTGLATVYRARDTSTKTLVMLKVFHDYVSREEESLLRYLQEMERIQRLRHPNIVPVHGVQRDEELAVLVMDYVPWPTLKVARGGVMPLGEVVAVICQVATALDYAHGQGVVHRDLRPSNVFYDQESGQVMVSDFGTATILEGGHALVRTTVNTPALSYMPPEQIQGQPPDPRGDVYALGVLAYECLTGERPFDALNPYTILSRQLTVTPTPPSQLEETLPSSVDNVVLKALTRWPGERYASCGEMAEALERAAGSQAMQRPVATEILGQQEALAESQQVEDGRVICRHCGSGNPATARRCSSCWGLLVAEPVITRMEEQQWMGRYLAKLRLRSRIVRSVLVGALLASIAFWAYNVIDLRPPLPAPSSGITSQSATGAWSMLQRDALHTGAVPGPAWTPEGTVKWKSTFQGQILATPAVAGGRVYVGTTDNIVAALDKATGDVLWEQPVNVPVYSQVAVAGDMLYVGMRNRTLIALDANTGELRWSYVTGNPIFGSVTVLDGSLYFGSSDRRLYSLDARTGEVRWIRETDGHVASSPAISQGIIVIGNQVHDLYMVDASNGTLRYVVDVGGPVGMSATIVDDIAYFTTHSRNVIAFDYTQKAFPFQKALSSFWFQLFVWMVAPPPPRTPGLVWSRRLGDSVLGDLATADGRLFIATLSGKLLALDVTTGDVLWQAGDLGRQRSSPIVSGDTVIQAAIDGTIYGFDVAAGDRLWSFSLEEEITASPILAGDTLYVPTVSGTLYALQ